MGSRAQVAHGTYLGEGWQLDFTQMPVSRGYILVMTDTFTGWIEGFPTQTEKDEEVKKKKKTDKQTKKNCSMKSF